MLLRALHGREHGGHDARGGGRCAHRGLLRLLVALVHQDLQQAVRDVLGLLLARADVHVHLVGVFEAERLGHQLQRPHRLGAGKPQPVLAHLAHEHVAAHLHVVGTGDLREVGTDLAAGRGRLHDVQPVAGGARALLGEHLHAVAHLQLVGQRHDGAVHLGAHAVVAHLGVDGVGEVHRRGAGAQAHDLALRREHEDLRVVEVHLQRL